MERGGALMHRRRTRLKHCTARLHHAVDSAIEAANFLTTRAGYCRYVSATLLARRAIEDRLTLSGAAAVYPAWPDRRIAHLVEDDLADLTAGTPIGGAAPRLAPVSAGAVLGALYVLEGSAMGARVIARRVSAMGMGPAFGARHLAHQAADPGAWPRFLAVLESAPLSDEEDESCARAAMATFECFKSHYERAA